MFKQLARQLANRAGYDIVRRSSGEPVAPPDISDADWAIVRAALPYTHTSVERLHALVDAVRYVSRNRIPGDIAECGVWRGGSMMAVALALAAENDTSRTLYLYDTYEGMTAPSEHDVRFDGMAAAPKYEEITSAAGKWCHAGIEDVTANMTSTGYPPDRLRYVVGKVEDTIPGTQPRQLALLRLDTDWYESTRHELNHLYPLVSPYGVVIFDDYGHWQGARKAADEYLAGVGHPVFLSRIDYTGRLMIKPG
jgi:O-methyltransferase